jgi:plasmid stabilization system protein ParE
VVIEAIRRVVEFEEFELLGEVGRADSLPQHVIDYRVEVETVTVLRILHGNMDAARHVEEI